MRFHRREARRDGVWVVILMSLLATACSGRSGVDNGVSAVDDAPTLPLVRPFPVDRKGETFESAIEIPERGKTQGNDVMIGFRVPVADKSFARLETLRRAEIPVVVRLTRDTSSDTVPVVL